MTPYIAIYLLAVFVSSVSQVLLKKAATEEHDSLIAEYLNVKVGLAYALFFLATLATVFAYRVLPLSLGAVLEATSYIYVTIFGVLLFKERVGPIKALALALIIIGIGIFAGGGL